MALGVISVLWPKFSIDYTIYLPSILILFCETITKFNNFIKMSWTSFNVKSMIIFDWGTPRDGILYRNPFPQKVVKNHLDISLKLFELQGLIKQQFVAFVMLFKKCQLPAVQKCIFWAPRVKMGPKMAARQPYATYFRT